MALTSMTGFARVEGQRADAQWTWELRSVNARGLDVRCRVPPGMGELEIWARNEAARYFRRGSLQLSLQLTATARESQLRINWPALDQVLEAVGVLRQRVADARLSLDGLLALPGVVEAAQADENGGQEIAILDDLKTSLEQGFERLALARAAEGAQLVSVLDGHVSEIAALADAAEAAAPSSEALQERLRLQVQELLAAVPALSEERLAQEAVLLAIKSDVGEEIARLRGHVTAARALLTEGGAVGRQLDFLTQEFNREANTLCAKSNNMELTRRGLELKAVIDRLREQVQNIE